MTYLSEILTDNPIIVAQPNTGLTGIEDKSAVPHSIVKSTSSNFTFNDAFVAGTSLGNAFGKSTQVNDDMYFSNVDMTQSNEWSFDCWIKQDSVDGVQGIFDIHTTSGPHIRRLVMWSNTLGFNTGAGDTYGIPLTDVPVGEWFHFAVHFKVNDLTYVRMWINGIEKVTGWGNATQPSAASSVLGADERFYICHLRTEVSGSLVDGTVSHMALYPSFVSAARIKAHAGYNYAPELGVSSPTAQEVINDRPSGYWIPSDLDPLNVLTSYDLNSRDMAIIGTHSIVAGDLPLQTGGFAYRSPIGSYAIVTDSVFNTGTEGMTAEVWFKPNAVPANGWALFGITDGAGLSWGAVFDVNLDLNIGTYSGAGWKWISEPFKLTVGELYHAVMVDDLTNITLYVNGVRITTTTRTTPLGQAGMVLGGQQGGQLDADIYEAATYQYQLGADRILAHYEAGAGVTVDAYADLIKSTSPVAYYPMNIESIGTRFIFDVGSSSAPQYMYTNTAYDSSDGIVGNGCMNVPALTDGSRSGDTAIVGVNGANAVTVELWYKRTSLTTLTGPIFSLEDQVAVGAPNLSLWYNASASMYAYTKTANGTTNGADDRAIPILTPINKWIHIAVVWDLGGGSVKVYINGVICVDAATHVGTFNNDLKLMLGAYYAVPSNYFAPGKYQHVAVHASILTPAEIQSRVAYGYPAPAPIGIPYVDLVTASNPISYWRLNESTGLTVADVMGKMDGSLNVDASTLSPVIRPLNQGDPDSTAMLWNDNAYAFVDHPQYLTTGAFSVEALVDGTTLGAVETSIFGAMQQGGYWLNRQTNNAFQLRIYDGGIYQNATAPSEMIRAGQINHIVGTFDGRYSRIYVNGVFGGSYDFGANFKIKYLASQKPVIGAQEDGAALNQKQRGYQTHTVWYNRALSIEEIRVKSLMVQGHVLTTPNAYRDLILTDTPFVYYPMTEPQHDELIMDLAGDNPMFINANGNPAVLGSTEIVQGAGTSLYVNNTTPVYYLPIDNVDWVGRTVMTTELWFNVDTLSTKRILSIGIAGELEGGNLLVDVDINSNGSIRYLWEYGAGNNETHYPIPAGSCVAGKTYHVVLCRDSATKKVIGWLNGIRMPELSYVNDPTGGATAGARLRFPAAEDGSSGATGYFSHLAFYDYVPTDTMVRAHYEAGAVLMAPNAYHDLVLVDTPVIAPRYDGTTILDRENYHLFTVVGGVTPVASALDAGIADRDSAMYFADGQYAYLNDPGNIPLDSNVTIEAWMKMDALTATDAVAVTLGGSVGNDYALVLRISVAGSNGSYFRDPTGVTAVNNQVDGTVFTPVAGQWYHVVGVFEPGVSVKYYIDGVLISEMANPYTSRYAGAYMWHFGQSYALSNKRGAIDQIAIYDTALTAAKIRARFELGRVRVVASNTYRDLVEASSPIFYPDGVGAAYNDTKYTLMRHYGTPGSTPSPLDIGIAGLEAAQSRPGGVYNYMRVDDDVAAPITVEAWMRVNGAAVTDMAAISMAYDNVGQNARYGFFMRIHNQGADQSGVWVYDGVTNNSVRYIGGWVPTVGQWYHVVATFEPGVEIKFYIDGVLMGTTPTTITSRHTTGLPWYTNIDYNGGTTITGDYDQIAMYQSVLSIETIREHYKVGRGLTEYELLVQTSAPLARFNLEDGFTVTDDYGNYTYTTTLPTGAALHTESTQSLFCDGVDTDRGRFTGVTPFRSKNVYSIEAWVQLTDHTDYINVYREAQSGGQIFAFTVSPSGITLNAHTGTVWITPISTTECIPIGVPVHIAATRNSTVGKIYINGVLVKTVTTESNAVASGSTYMAIGSAAATNQGFTMGRGYIDDVILYNRECTGTEIKARYDAVRSGTFVKRLLDDLNVVSHITYDSTLVDARSNITGTAIGDATLVAGVKSPGALQTTYAGLGHVNFADYKALDPRTDDFTAMCWFKISAGNGGSSRLFEKKGTGQDDGWQIATDELGTEGFGNTAVFKTGVTYNSGPIPAPGIFDNQWHHVAIVFENSTGDLQIYLDGVLIGTKLTPLMSGVDIANVNPYATNGTYDLFQQINGQTDEHIFFKRKATLQQIVQLKNLGDPRFKVSGNVTQNGIPAQRVVRLYDRVSGALVNEFLSSASTGEFEIQWNDADLNKEYYVIALDDDINPILDPITHDRITPVAV